MIFSKTSRPETEARVEASADNSPESSDAVEEEVIQAAESEAPTEASEDWQAKCLLLQDQYARLAADFDNYRKRIREEQEAMVKYGAQKTVLELLPVLDNLERAAGSLTENSDPAVLFKSFGVVQKQLLDKMDALGVKKIPAIGQMFDPQFHEAVNRMESVEFPENTIMYEAQSGYTLHDRVIRPAMVVVSTGSPKDETAAATDDTSKESGSEADDTSRDNPFRQ